MRNIRHLLFLCVLAVILPAVILAQGLSLPGGPQDGTPTPSPIPPPPPIPPFLPPPEPMPTGPPDAYPPPPPGPPKVAPSPTPTPFTPPPALGSKNVPTPEGPRPHAYFDPNRIVRHAATPARLIKTGSGLQYYYVGADGSTASGPLFPSFSQLAKMYPSGGWVSLLSTTNPLTGKQVNVDYIPSEMKIRVSTFYPDTEYDTNKPYIFNFGSDYSVNVEAW